MMHRRALGRVSSGWISNARWSSTRANSVLYHHVTATPLPCLMGNSSSIIPTTTHHHRPFSSMALIKELRTASGAPIVDCKKALANSDNDMKKALDWLREHGAAKVSSKVADRQALEGLVSIAVSDDHQEAALVQVASETDFAGRSETFVDLVEFCAQAALMAVRTDSDDNKFKEELLDYEHDSKKVGEVIKEAIVAIRENLSLSHVTKMSAAEGGVVVGYVHGRVMPSQAQAGTAAALVDLSPISSDSGVDRETMLEVGKKLAMHIVAAKPLYLDSSSIPDDIVNAEREILSKQIADSGKPPEIVSKIVEGRLKKFYSTVCLLDQSHMIEEGNPAVQKYLKGLGIRLNQFQLISIG